MNYLKMAPRLLVLMVVLTPLIVFSGLSKAAKPVKAASFSEYAIVELASPGAARYKGDKKGLPATANANGRFDLHSGAYHSYKAHLENEHANFRSAMNRSAVQARAVRSFYITSNAVVVELNGATANQLRRINGVKKVYESTLYKPTMDTSVALIGADTAWPGLPGGREDAGEGVRVAVIDSGNPSSLIPGFHDFFSGDCPPVELGGFYYSGETGVPAIDIKSENGNEPAPGFAWVSDHGSHVAGTIGGCLMTISGGPWDGTELSGVAPGATLVDYNVFPGLGAGYVAFGGSALSHDIASAIEDAVANGDHVINMSLGGGAQGPHDFLAEVSNAAVDAGVVVVTSAGNSGPGAYTVGSPGVAANVITVGASTNTRGMGVTLDAPGLATIKAYAGDFPDFDSSAQTMITWPGSDAEACTSDVADDSLASEVVLIARGTCSFSQKMANAKAAGAGGAVVYSDDRDPGGMAGTDGFDDQIPAVMISNADGQVLLTALDDAGGTLEAVIISGPTIVQETPNLLADFSSRGPAAFTGIVKPDVLAPGVNILSSVFSGFELFDGTSMASPHVAGSVAILLEMNPDWTPAQVKSALATTATKDHSLEPWEQGSGIINIPAALATNAFFTPTNASFGVFQGKAPATGSIDIDIDSASDCAIDDVSGEFVTADVDNNLLTVNFDAGRREPAGNYGGYAIVDCGGDLHTIPWGAVVNR
ncbi:MAG: S8 family serine peptidase [Halioglobus sp.]